MSTQVLKQVKKDQLKLIDQEIEIVECSIDELEKKNAMDPETYSRMYILRNRLYLIEIQSLRNELYNENQSCFQMNL